jgi:hypothetical protein
MCISLTNIRPLFARLITDADAWIGAVCLSFCGVPAAFKAIEDGHARGMSGSFLALWFVGEIAMLCYVARNRKGAALVTNYLANVLVVAVIVYFKLVGE